MQEQLDSALEPVIAAKLAAHPVGDEAVQALLTISVIDPACGSGHFLLAAARRIAGHLARIRAQIRDAMVGHGGQPTPDDYRHALRDVVTHCVYGVDMNPMALELARMALWLEAYTPDAPLGFIDHHFQLGNALLGVLNPKTLLEGVPDEAYKELTGDDRALCRDLKARNRRERQGLLRMRAAASFSQSLQAMDLAATAGPLQHLDALPDDTLDNIAAKRQAYVALKQGVGDDDFVLALHLYCAAFLLPKQGTDTDTEVPTTQDVANALMGQPVAVQKRDAAIKLAQSTPLLHWQLGFAQVFARGGFSVVLANPPWDQSQFSDVEFFASRAPSIAALEGEARKMAIATLELDDPALWGALQHQMRAVESQNLFFRFSGRYPLTAIGKLNTYPLFAETTLQILSPTGRAGLVLPSGIATDDSSKVFFSHLLDENRLVSMLGFDNALKIFPAVHPDTPFCLLTIGTPFSGINFAHYLLSVKDLADSRRVFALTVEDINLLNPNTRTCPVLRSRKDAEIAKRLYSRVPILIDESNDDANQPSGWSVQVVQNFFSSSNSEDRRLFTGFSALDAADSMVPVIRGTMVDQFDHCAAVYEGATSRFVEANRSEGASLTLRSDRYVPSESLESKISARGWQHQWLLGWRDITNATNWRTVIAAVVPLAATDDTFSLLLPRSSAPLTAICLVANLNSLVLDYVAGSKVGGTHVRKYVMSQLPVIPVDAYNAEVLQFVASRALELTFTTNEMAPFYADVIGLNENWDRRSVAERGTPFVWDPLRRAVIRAELDAIFARLYGLSRDELRYILDPKDVMGADYPSETFRVLKSKETRSLGEYRTQRLVLDAWDRLEAGGLV